MFSSILITNIKYVSKRAEKKFCTEGKCEKKFDLIL